MVSSLERRVYSFFTAAGSSIMSLRPSTQRVRPVFRSCCSVESSSRRAPLGTLSTINTSGSKGYYIGDRNVKAPCLVLPGRAFLQGRQRQTVGSGGHRKGCGLSHPSYQKRNRMMRRRCKGVGHEQVPPQMTQAHRIV